MTAAEASPLANALPARRADRAPAMILADIDSHLQELCAAFSEKFLSLGGILQENSQLARQLTQRSHQANGAEAVAHCTASIRMLQSVLDEVELSGQMVAASRRDMGEILRSVEQIVAPLNRLTVLSRQLKIFAVLTRIEGACLVDQTVDVQGLSNDIARLGSDVDERVLSLCEGATSLAALLRARVAELGEHAEDERTRARDLGVRVRSILEPTLARLGALESDAVLLADEFLNFQRATDGVVISLQSEDMARQRLEHIQQAIRRAGRALEAGEDAGRLGSIFGLQRSQLEDTRSVIEEALRTIHDGLKQLAPVVQGLALRSVEQAEQAAAGGRSFADHITQELPGMLEVFQQCSRSVRAVRQMADAIYPSVKAMTNGADALGRVAFAIQLLSLNTSVKTAQLGGRGAPLGVLANELQTVIDSSAGDTAEVLRGLTSIESSLASMNLQRSSSQEMLLLKDEQDDGLRSTLEQPLAAVRSSNDAVSGSLEQVQELARALIGGIEQGSELSADPGPILGLFDQQLREMDAAFELLGYVPGAKPDGGVAEHAEGLAELYSMESERELHRAILGQDAGGPAVAPSPDSEFGDSVELF